MAKETTKKDKKNKKHFWKDFKAELKKVIWPTPNQLFKNTVAVVFIVIVTAAIVFLLDLAFSALNIYSIKALKPVTNNTEIVESVDDEASTEEIDITEGSKETEEVTGEVEE